MLRNKYRQQVSSTAGGRWKHRTELVICSLRFTGSDKTLVEYVTICNTVSIAPRYV